MSSFIRSCALVGALFAAISFAGPVAVRDVEVLPMIEERGLPLITLGSYSLETSHVNDVLLNIGASKIDGHSAQSLRLLVECVDCRTWGTAVVTTGGAEKNDDVIGDIIGFFENPLETVVDAFNLNVKVSFENVGGHYDFHILASDTVSYSYPIFASQTFAGAAVSDDVSVGLVLFIDLVFSLTAEIDLEAGFEFAFPEGAYITVDPIGGNIVDHGFSGGDVNSLPIIVKSGSATFKAALRVRVQAGTTIELFGTGFDFELGVYADLIEYVATLTTTPRCELEITECIDVNVGAFAHAVAEIDYKTFGINPPALITTLLSVPLPSLCLTRPTGVASLPPSIPTGSVTVLPISSLTGIPAEAGASSTILTFFPSITASAASSSETGASSAIPTFFPSLTASAAVSSTVPTFSNSSSTITAVAELTTSTVYSTTEITLTSCSSTVLHCPASLASEIVITSSVILYTTVCPVGATLPTFVPSFSVSASTTSSAVKVVQTVVTSIVSAVKLIPCETPAVETIYTPTFNNPIYTMPTATAFTVPNPNWNATVTFITPKPTIAAGYIGAVGPSSAASVKAVVSSVTVFPIASVSGLPRGNANSTVLATGSVPKPTTNGLVAFTGAGSKSLGTSVAALVGMFIGAVMLL